MENSGNNNKENNNNNKENLLVKSLEGLVGFLFILVVVFLVVSFVKNLYIDFQNKNKDKWIIVYDSKNKSIYYNPSKIIHTQNGNVKMWTRLTGKSIKDRAMKIGAENGVSAEKYNNWAFDEVLVEFDCKNQNMRILYELSRDADENIIYEENGRDSFSPVIPDSPGEKLYKIACENQSFLCKLPFLCK
jgi:hypothetical protein